MSTALDVAHDVGTACVLLSAIVLLLRLNAPLPSALLPALSAPSLRMWLSVSLLWALALLLQLNAPLPPALTLLTCLSVALLLPLALARLMQLNSCRLQQRWG